MTVITLINTQNNQSFGITYDRSTLEITEIDFGLVAVFIIDVCTSFNGLNNTILKEVLQNVFVKSGSYSNRVIN